MQKSREGLRVALAGTSRRAAGLSVLAALLWPGPLLADQIPEGYRTGRVGKIFAEERAEQKAGPQPPAADDGSASPGVRPAYGSVLRVIIAGDARTYVGLLAGAANNDRALGCLVPGSSVRFRIDDGRMRVRCAGGADIEFPVGEMKGGLPSTSSGSPPK